MTMLAEAVEIARKRTEIALLTKPLLSIRGRPIIFTPERIDQIRNLRERGKTPEEIAEIIGCTVGTLRVKCSNLGISLRALVPKNIMMLPPKRNGDNGEPKLVVLPLPQPKPEKSFSLSLQLSYRGLTKTVPIPVSDQMLAVLVLEAEMRGMHLGELIVTIIQKVIERNLVEELFSSLPPASE